MMKWWHYISNRVKGQLPQLRSRRADCDYISSYLVRYWISASHLESVVIAAGFQYFPYFSILLLLYSNILHLKHCLLSRLHLNVKSESALLDNHANKYEENTLNTFLLTSFTIKILWVWTDVDVNWNFTGLQRRTTARSCF